MSTRWFDAVVTRRRNLTDRICELQLAPADATGLPMAEAGSHVEVRFGGAGGLFHRHYSVVGPLTLDDAHERFWRIAVQREDRARGSAYLHDNLREGDRLQVSHALGAFRLGAQKRPVLLIAGGIGITAILPMLRSLIVRQRDVTMLYVGRSHATMAYADEVAAMGGGKVTLHESATDGRPHLVELLSAQPDGTVVFVCGPVALINEVRDTAHHLGWPKGRVRYEVFNQAHHDGDAGFTVNLPDGRAVDVRAGTTILDAFEAAGIDTLSDCRRGECGLCLTQVVDAGEGIDHRDRYLDGDERARNDQIAICCSRAIGPKLHLAP